MPDSRHSHCRNIIAFALLGLLLLLLRLNLPTTCTCSRRVQAGGYTDYNAYHEAEAAVDEKWVAQQFIWSHPRLDWRRILEKENWEPSGRRSDDTI